jgi:hypothetical protein
VQIISATKRSTRPCALYGAGGAADAMTPVRAAPRVSRRLPLGLLRTLPVPPTSRVSGATQLLGAVRRSSKLLATSQPASESGSGWASSHFSACKPGLFTRMKSGRGSLWKLRLSHAHKEMASSSSTDGTGDKKGGGQNGLRFSVAGLFRDTARSGERERARGEVRQQKWLCECTAMIRPTTTTTLPHGKSSFLFSKPHGKSKSRACTTQQRNRALFAAHAAVRPCTLAELPCVWSPSGFLHLLLLTKHYRFIVVRAWFLRKTQHNVYICSTSTEDGAARLQSPSLEKYDNHGATKPADMSLWPKSTRPPAQDRTGSTGRARLRTSPQALTSHLTL